MKEIKTVTKCSVCGYWSFNTPSYEHEERLYCQLCKVRVLPNEKPEVKDAFQACGEA
jgi:DNA-directed RNA polymerase subunit RPC12/RpoP